MTQDETDFLSRASAAFMTLDITVSNWKGTKIASDASLAAAAAQANADDRAGILSVRLLGQHQAELSEVNAAYTRVRTYLYENTLPSSNGQGGAKQKQGPRMVSTYKMPRVLGELKRLVKEANDLRDRFLVRYDSLAADAKANSLGQWGADIDIPDASEAPRPVGVPKPSTSAAPVTSSV